jgi:general secretion pathway protein L
MRPFFPRPALEPIFDRLEAAWCWWLAELRGLVPGAVRRRLAPAPPVLVLGFEAEGVALGRCVDGAYSSCGRIGADEIDGPMPKPLGAALAVTRADRVELRLPAAQGLRHRLTLPLASPRRLGALLRFELDRQTPFTPAQIYYAARVVQSDRAEGRMAVDLVMVKRKAADRALDQSRRWGLSPYRLTIQGMEGWSLDFLPPKRFDRRTFGRHRLSIALAVGIVGCTVAAWYLHVTTSEKYVETLNAEIVRSRNAAELTKSVQKELDSSEARIAFLAGREQAIGTGRLLEELAARLPDDTWVSEFELTGKTFRIHGYSAQAPALPGRLGESVFLTNAHFTGPLVLAGAGSERFDLSADVMQGGGK